jgi:sugar transferase (PEP-CTERM/EpsH1 system associated)
MKILFVCHRFPFPPKRGGKIRPFNIIQHLQQHHAVTVASIARSEEEAEEGRGLGEYCEDYIMAEIGPWVANARMVSRLATAKPSTMGYFYSSELRRAIQRKLREIRYDLIFVHCSSVAQYVADVQGIPKILDFGDMDSQKWLDYARFKRFPLALGYWLEGTKLERVERHLARRFDICTCTTRAEKATLDAFAAARATEYFPNGVDSQYFTPVEAPYDANEICFIGRMDYYPNQECMRFFTREVLPVIQRDNPQARLTIIGANPSAEIRSMGQLPGVTVTGSVKDVRPYVYRAAVNVAPLNIARGTQNKILESMAMGVPVVASELAARGIDAVAGEHLMTATTASDYATAVSRLMRSPDLRNQFSAAGRHRMETHHSWTKSMQRLDAIIATCTKSISDELSVSAFTAPGTPH